MLGLWLERAGRGARENGEAWGGGCYGAFQDAESESQSVDTLLP